MKFSSIVVAGAARNCGKFITKDIERLQKVLAGWAKVQFIIIESDSTDNTLEQLESLKQSVEGFYYISMGELRGQFPKRTERLALCRNRYLEELKSNEVFRDAKYVLVTDLDGTNELLTPENLASCWEIEDWDVCTANQLGHYYDIWALRHPLFSPNDCWESYRFMMNKLGAKPKVAEKKALKSRMFWFHRSVKPFEVDSAFGGLAIYKRHALEDVQYAGVDEHGAEVCEHVALNKQIRAKGYKIYINPKLINCYPPTQYVESKLKKMLLVLKRKAYAIAQD